MCLGIASVEHTAQYCNKVCAILSDRVPSPDSAVVLLVYLGIMRQRKTESIKFVFLFVFLYALDLSLGVIDYCAILSDG